MLLDTTGYKSAAMQPIRVLPTKPCDLFIYPSIHLSVHPCMQICVHLINSLGGKEAVRTDKSTNTIHVLSSDVMGGWDDVEVGYLLGRGSSGSVYRAKWNGKHVAVKVRHQRLCTSWAVRHMAEMCVHHMTVTTMSHDCASCDSHHLGL